MSLKKFSISLLLSAAFLALSGGVYGQTPLPDLSREVEFAPRSAKPLEQLVEVAKQFRIPMAVEWQKSAGRPRAIADLTHGRRSLKDLIEAILRQMPGHEMRVEGGLLHIFQPSAASHPFNFLNIRIDSFRMKEAHLFDAEAHLRMMINLTLYPELFAGGYGGGHGHTPGHVFTIPNISISEENLTIREILNKITEANGNALWVVEFGADEFAGSAPIWAGKPLDEYGHSPINTRWRFIPLAEISELAKERIVVELEDDAGCLAGRRVVLHVIAEHGLSEGVGNYSRIFSSNGLSCGYGVSISKVKKDVATLSVELFTKAAGGSEKRVSESITVMRKAVRELKFDGGITLRAFFDGGIESHVEPYN